MWTIDELLQGTQGALKGKWSKNGCFGDFSIDSRTIKKNDLFIALSGPNFDGHNYVEQVFTLGAAGAVVSRRAFEIRKNTWSALAKDRFFVLVDDPLCALQNLAKWHRKRFDLPVICVTGSNGKTTTKEMIAAILEQQSTVLKTEGNLNNHIGLPLSLLRLKASHQTAVFEMGISGKGEMAQLCDIAQPTIGLITNIGAAHLEGLVDLSGVAAEKGQLFEHVAEDGLAVINQDDEHLKPWETRLNNTWTFGLDPDADITARDIVQTEGTTRFTLRRNRRDDALAGIKLAMPGLHQVQNSLAAAAVTSALGASLENISEGLRKLKPLPGRMQTINKNGINILFDAYNANPDSVNAALELLVNTASQGKRVALLGEMLELGKTRKSAHFEIGCKVGILGIDHLIAVGPSAEVIAAGATSEGMQATNIMIHSETALAAASLKRTLKPGDLLLMKASRGMYLERLLDNI